MHLWPFIHCNPTGKKKHFGVTQCQLSLGYLLLGQWITAANFDTQSNLHLTHATAAFMNTRNRCKLKQSKNSKTKSITTNEINNILLSMNAQFVLNIILMHAPKQSCSWWTLLRSYPQLIAVATHHSFALHRFVPTAIFSKLWFLNKNRFWTNQRAAVLKVSSPVYFSSWFVSRALVGIFK